MIKIIQWVAFAILLIVPPLLLFFLTYFSCKNSSISKYEKKKTIIRNTYLFIWNILWALFYMARFNGWLGLIFIFGCLMIIISLFQLSNAFILPGRKNLIEKIELLYDFLVCLGVGIYLIYIIPIREVKEVIIPIVSTTFGGLITLVGVAWTIKWNYFQRKEDHLNSLRPAIYLSRSMDSEYSEEDCIKELNFYEIDLKPDGKKDYSVIPKKIGHIKNTNKAQFYFVSFSLNRHIYFPLTPLCVELDKEYGITLNSFGELNEQKYNLEIEVEDLERNKYIYSATIIQTRNGYEFKTLKAENMEE